jgi:hypothetical protein
MCRDCLVSVSHSRSGEGEHQAKQGHPTRTDRQDAIQCLHHASRNPIVAHLGGLPVTEEKVVTKEAIGMRQAAGHGIDSGHVSIALFRHPAACFVVHEPTPMTD